jgi:hypothetical protein
MVIEATGLAVQADAGIAVAFDPTFDQYEQVSPHRLRAGIAAPHTPCGRGEEKQAKPRHNQQASDEIKLVRPNLDHEEKEPA